MQNLDFFERIVLVARIVKSMAKYLGPWPPRLLLRGLPRPDTLTRLQVSPTKGRPV